MADIFISYKKTDFARVAPIKTLLEEQGWSVWIDTRLEAGDLWDAMIERELAAALCVVVIWTPDSVNSHWVRTEAIVGLERKILVPVTMGGKPPLAFKLVQFADLLNWDGDAAAPGARTLISGVRKILGEAPLLQMATPASTMQPPMIVVDPGSPRGTQAKAHLSNLAKARAPEGGATTGRVLGAVGAGVGALAIAFLIWKPAPELDPSRAAKPLTPAELAVLKSVTQQAPDQTFKECAECPEMVVVQPGTFVMGSGDGAARLVQLDGSLGDLVPKEEGRSDEEGPAHEVRIQSVFAVGKFEVTFNEWQACVLEKGCQPLPGVSDGKGQFPVSSASWKTITTQYLPWLSNKTGATYVLPTESEWEYAARAKTITPYSWGTDQITSKLARFETKGGPFTVGSYQPNNFGLYDVHGNVWEITESCWTATHPTAQINKTVTRTTTCPDNLRAAKGGGWRSKAEAVRSATRLKIAEWDGVNRNDFGFRVVRKFN